MREGKCGLARAPAPAYPSSQPIVGLPRPVIGQDPCLLKHGYIPTPLLSLRTGVIGNCTSWRLRVSGKVSLACDSCYCTVLLMGQTCVASGCLRTCTNVVVDRLKLNSVKFTFSLKSICSCCCETGRYKLQLH